MLNRVCLGGDVDEIEVDDVDDACDGDEVDIDDVKDVYVVDMIYIGDVDDVKDKENCTRCSPVCNAHEIHVDHQANWGSSSAF